MSLHQSECKYGMFYVGRAWCADFTFPDLARANLEGSEVGKKAANSQMEHCRLVWLGGSFCVRRRSDQSELFFLMQPGLELALPTLKYSRGTILANKAGCHVLQHAFRRYQAGKQADSSKVPMIVFVNSRIRRSSWPRLWPDNLLVFPHCAIYNLKHGRSQALFFPHHADVVPWKF